MDYNVPRKRFLPRRCLPKTFKGDSNSKCDCLMFNSNFETHLPILERIFFEEETEERRMHEEYHFCDKMFYKNGKVITLFDGPRVVKMRTLYEENGTFKKESVRFINNHYNEIVFSDDMKYFIKVEIVKSTYVVESSLCFSIYLFVESSPDHGYGLNNGYEEYYTSELNNLWICGLTRKEDISKTLYCKLSPRSNYIGIITFTELPSEIIYLDLFNIDFSDKTAKHYRCVQIQKFFNQNHSCFQIEFSKNEKTLLVTQYVTEKRWYICNTVLYSIQDDLLVPIYLNKQTKLGYCRYIEDYKYGGLVFSVVKTTGEYCNDVEIDRFESKALIKLKTIQLKDFGIKRRVTVFKVQTYNNMKMFVGHENYIYVIDPFSQLIISKLFVGCGSSIRNIFINWSGQEITTLARKRECYYFYLKVFYIPNDDALFSLKKLSKAAVMEFISLNSLKDLNLPNIVKYQLDMI